VFDRPSLLQPMSYLARVLSSLLGNGPSDDTFGDQRGTFVGEVELELHPGTKGRLSIYRLAARGKRHVLLKNRAGRSAAV
jgi:hypothetical protein